MIAKRFLPALVAAALAFLASGAALAQATPAAAKPAETKPSEPQDDGPLADLAWLAGCWRGSVNQREFREHWMPLRGSLIVGSGHTVVAGKTQDFEYLRIEPRADGVFYVAQPSGGAASAFRLAERKTDGADTVFTFARSGPEFPQSIVYRRATGGWLYVHVEGTVGGEERRVIYPFRRVDCETNDFIEK